jgi:acyl carrier protein
MKLTDGLAAFDAVSVTESIERPMIARGTQDLLDRLPTGTIPLSEFSRIVWGSVESPALRHVVASQSTGTDQQTKDRSRTGVLKAVLREVAAVIDTSPASIDPERGLVDHGIDSVRGLQLRAQLNREFSVSLPATAIFSYPTARLLAEAIIAQLDVDHQGKSLTTGTITALKNDSRR